MGQKEIFQIQLNIVENSNWQEVDQMAIYKHGQGVELGTIEKQQKLVVRARLEPGPPDYKSDALITQPHFLADAQMFMP